MSDAYNKEMPDSMAQMLRNWQKGYKNDSEVRRLIFLAKYYFHVQRLPCHEDINLASIKNIDNDFFAIFKQDNEKFQKLLKDFKKMYKNTQGRLKEKFPNKRSIKLLRRIIRSSNCGKGQNILECDSYNCFPSLRDFYNYISRQKNSKKDIKIAMDVINSWAECPSSSYGMIIFEKDIPIEDVVYFQDEFDYSGPLESGEYIVINRSMSGCVDFSPEDVNCENLKISLIGNQKNNRNQVISGRINSNSSHLLNDIYLGPYQRRWPKKKLLGELYSTYICYMQSKKYNLE